MKMVWKTEIRRNHSEFNGEKGLVLRRAVGDVSAVVQRLCGKAARQRNRTEFQQVPGRGK
jgi:hypothetical protein